MPPPSKSDPLHTDTCTHTHTKKNKINKLWDYCFSTPINRNCVYNQESFYCIKPSALRLVRPVKLKSVLIFFFHRQELDLRYWYLTRCSLCQYLQADIGGGPTPHLALMNYFLRFFLLDSKGSFSGQNILSILCRTRVIPRLWYESVPPTITI